MRLGAWQLGRPAKHVLYNGHSHYDCLVEVTNAERFVAACARYVVEQQAALPSQYAKASPLPASQRPGHRRRQRQAAKGPASLSWTRSSRGVC